MHPKSAAKTTEALFFFGLGSEKAEDASVFLLSTSMEPEASRL
jgi:hypothetical protein